MFNILRDNRGFIFLEVLFLTLILSFTALLVCNALESAIISNRMSAIRIAAIHLANARMAEIEEYNFEKNSFQIPSTSLTNEDLVYKDFFGINGTIEFVIDNSYAVQDSNPTINEVTVTVKWIINGNENYGNATNEETVTKYICLIPAGSEDNAQP